MLGYYATSSVNFLPLFRVNLCGPIRFQGCPETSVMNYHYSLRNNPEERSSHLLRGGSNLLSVCIIQMTSNRANQFRSVF